MPPKEKEEIKATVETPEDTQGPTEEKVTETITGINPAPAANVVANPATKHEATAEEIAGFHTPKPRGKYEETKDTSEEEKKEGLAYGVNITETPDILAARSRMNGYQPEGQITTDPNLTSARIDVELPKAKAPTGNTEEVKGEDMGDEKDDFVEAPERAEQEEGEEEIQPELVDGPTTPYTGPDYDEEETSEGTEAGSEENAEAAAEELQGINAEDIPQDPDDFEAWVQSHPETKKIYDFLINDSEAKLKESQKKERREAAGIALGNLMRAFTNLYYTTQGSPNAYNNEEAAKVTQNVHDRYEKWRKQLDENRKERWEQYQKLREQYSKEKQQRHKEDVDAIELQIKMNDDRRKERLAALDEQIKTGAVKKSEAEALRAQIIADHEEENQRLQQEKTRQQTNTEKSKQASNYASAKKSERDATSNEKKAEADMIRANAYANGKKDDDEDNPWNNSDNNSDDGSFNIGGSWNKK